VGVELMRRIDADQRDFARALRSNLTDAERMLWQRLRQRQLQGERFRRQFPIGEFVADFACIDKQLVVEVDGGQHAGSEHDRRRDRELQRRGWRVLRFWNNEVIGNLEGVLEMITMALAAVPPPQPSPLQGEGAKT
jgi:very-short-patch-repair endonuclease